MCNRTTTTPVFEVHLQFGRNYTPAKFRVYISIGCNAVVLTRFCRLGGTNRLANVTYQNTRNHIQGMSPEPSFWFMNSARNTRWKQYWLSPS